MRHPPGDCDLTGPGLYKLKSGPAKASWAELSFGITRLLPSLRARLYCFPTISPLLPTSPQLPSSFKGNYDLTFRTDHAVGRYGIKG